MGVTEELSVAYEKQLRLGLDESLSPEERIWYVVYDPQVERRLRLRIGIFETITVNEGYNWHLFSFEKMFEEWVASHRYREEYFREPSLIKASLDTEFQEYIFVKLSEKIYSINESNRSVIAILGAGYLSGLVSVSVVCQQLVQIIAGRLLIFFPGSVESNNFKLLNDSDGHDYRAIVIKST